jgi:hypothetical protein
MVAKTEGNWENLSLDGRITLRWMFKKYRVSIKSFPDYIYYKKTTWNTNIFFTCFYYQLDAQFLYFVIYVLH